MGNPVQPPVPPRRRPKRGIARRLAVWISLVTAVLLTACAGIAAVVYTSAHTSTADSLEFATPLAVPPVLEPGTDAEGRKRFPMDIQAGTSELLPGVSTPTWGVNGAYLGPTLRLERGDDVADVGRQSLEVVDVAAEGFACGHVRSRVVAALAAVAPAARGLGRRCRRSSVSGRSLRVVSFSTSTPWANTS